MIDDSDEEVLYGTDSEELLSISLPNGATQLDDQNDNKDGNLVNKIECVDLIGGALPGNVDNTIHTTVPTIPNLIDTRTDEESD